MPEARSDSNDNVMAVEAEPPKQSQDVWFSDGNIVLQAQNVQFKVHKSVLAKHSSVFADLFEMPHTNGDEETADGCPIVQLHDSADDIKHMTLTLYGDKAYNNVSGGLPMPVVAAMVRMGRKYDIEHIKLEGLSRLNKFLPESLDDWDRTEAALAPWEDAVFPSHTITLDSESDQAILDIAAEAMKLAYECQIETILPACYFIVCRDYSMYMPNSPEISAGAAIRGLEGRRQLSRTRCHLVYGWIEAVGEYSDCLHPAECLTSGRLLMSRIWRCPSLLDIFDQWAKVATKYDDLVQTLCSNCASQAEISHNAGRIMLWENLPEFFGLGSWDYLRGIES
ncbi:hypothetical protein DFP72DRAFT_1014314 [Ephemerocybe angulata]|uniref:BTB domain-containing protein n=1 Tax=Ephemerocybe angulata TaxID=980116 RepID=A0A8H6HLV9_9AGAR|nr:hypothetical protein DFP72DRAFT_1014314 [Tulosesus angulatus]